MCVVALACCAQISFAQMKVTNLPGQKSPVIQIPMVHIIPVSGRFVPVHVDTVKPFVVSLGPIVFKKQESASCLQLKKRKATLVLNAERANDAMANLRWQTKYAFYATGFNIERSLGNSLHFSTIATAAVSEETSFKINYSLPDYNDYSGLSFYRIKQLNRDTGFVYSNIVSIKGIESLPFKIYPNPASNTLRIDIMPNQSGNFEIVIYDAAGKMIQQQTGVCTQYMHATTSMDISDLAAGSYQVKVLQPDKAFLAGKFVKK